MADDPKPETKASPSPEQPEATNVSPAPIDVVEKSPDNPGGSKTAPEMPPGADTPQAGPQPEALSDGTVPTVLKKGARKTVEIKSKASIATLYRKADVTTTLLTFVGALVAAGIVVGAYAYITRNSNKPTQTSNKVTTLDKAELDKLESFFGGNSAGKETEILTISSSSLFKNRVAIGSDLKITGGLQVSGGTALADLTVDKTSTLGVTNVRGALTVSGPLNLQSPAILGAGATINGNLAVSGNTTLSGSLGVGTLNVRDLSISGTLNLNGHLNVGGQTPTAAPDSAAGPGATATVSGNDSAGTVTINTGSSTSNDNLGGSLVKVTFKNPFPASPVIVITANGRGAALLTPYTIKTAGFFIIGSATDPAPRTSYSFDYWVIQ